MTTMTRIGGGVAAVVLLGSLSACGADDTSAAGTDQPGTQQGSGGQGTQLDTRGGGMPGTSGEIASVSGDVLQVRETDGQVAVTVTGSTTITDQVAAKASAVEVGACVVVRSSQTTSAPTGAATDAAPSPPTDLPTEIDAASVAVSTKPSSGCTAGPGGMGAPGGMGGGGTPPSDFTPPTDMPTDMPTDGTRPDGAGGPGGMRGGFAFGAAGEVTKVTATGFEVTQGDRVITVITSGTTTYTQQVKASRSALTVGRCVRATGDADDTGAVTAETLQVSDKVDDRCGR